jgi:hypothetical protein
MSCLTALSLTAWPATAGYPVRSTVIRH